MGALVFGKAKTIAAGGLGVKEVQGDALVKAWRWNPQTILFFFFTYKAH